jgi:hypothetical protein
MKTIANVYLLPTEYKKSSYIPLFKLNKDSRLSLLEGFGHTISEYFHLYITLPQSDLEISKIKEGDWFINSRGLIFKTDKNYIEERDEYCLKTHEKIITTTNPNLLIGLTEKSSDGIKYNHLPIYVSSIPQQFIEHFISEYNKGNVISSVEVELEEEIAEWVGPFDPNATEINLKLNQQNEISIVIPEKITNLNNIKEILIKFKNDFSLHRGIQIMESDVDTWINNNLNLKL